MTDLEPWTVDDPPPDIDYHSATTAVLNAAIQSLTTSKEIVQPNLVKSVFDSALAILTLVRDEMIEEDSFTELAKLCIRTCHVLQTVTEGRDFDDLSGLIRRQIEDTTSSPRSENGQTAPMIYGNVTLGAPGNVLSRGGRSYWRC